MFDATAELTRFCGRERVVSIYYWGPNTALPDAMKTRGAQLPQFTPLQVNFHEFLKECHVREETSLMRV